MLTIRRVPTILSLNQEGGCGRDCLGTCCVPGSNLPLYTFTRKTKTKKPEKHTNYDNDTYNDEPPLPLFLETLLLAQWEERASEGLFRYDVTACESQILPGRRGYIAQLNEGRHLKKRPTEFRVDQVLQKFDPSKFNFTKVNQREVLFRFEESDKAGYYPKAPVLTSPNIVAINVSPIEYGHVLLVPRVLDCIPQQIEYETLLLALHFSAEAKNPYFRIGYNSLGAFATINHLHFQAYYLACPFPVESASTVRIKRKKSLKISELIDYPVKALVYESLNLEQTAYAVARACETLQEKNIPFNFLISDCGARVFLFPQCFARKQALNQVPNEVLDTQVNPAVWEISGHIVLKRKEDYERATEEYAENLLAQVSLAEDEFKAVKDLCLATEVLSKGTKSLKLVEHMNGILINV